MNKGRKFLIMTLVFLLVFLVGSYSGAQAKDGNEKIDVVFRNIQLLINGKNVPATGENEPFIYRGRTFVPLRLVSDALGYEVDWDGDNFTVIIGDTAVATPAPAPTNHNLIDILPPYTITGATSVKFFPTTSMESLTMGGAAVKNSMSISAGAAPQSAYFNLGGKYKSLTGVIGTLDSANKDAMVKFIADGVLIESVDVINGELPKNFALNTTGVQELKIEHAGNNGGAVGLAKLILTTDPAARIPESTPIPASQRLIDALPPYSVTATTAVKAFPTTSTGSIKLGGIVYKNSLSLRVGAAPQSASFNLSGNYTTLTGLIGTVDNVSRDAMVNFFADGSVIKTMEISGGALPQHFSLDVSNVDNLKIEHVGDNGGEVGLAELNLK